MTLVIGGLVEGDIVLVEPGRANGSVIGQRMLRGWLGQKAVHSHVAVVCCPGVIMHATTQGGVHLDIFRDFVMEREGDTITVLRNPTIAGDEEKRRAIMESLLFHLEKGYNFLITFRARSPALFCSELAGMVYEAVGHPLSARDAWKMLPVDVAEATRHWVDVTGEVIRRVPKGSTHVLGRSFDEPDLLEAGARHFKKLFEVMNEGRASIAHSTRMLDRFNELLEEVGRPTLEFERYPAAEYEKNWRTARGSHPVPPRKRRRKSP